jgi:hypothetical protein
MYVSQSILCEQDLKVEARAEAPLLVSAVFALGIAPLDKFALAADWQVASKRGARHGGTTSSVSAKFS